MAVSRLADSLVNVEGRPWMYESRPLKLIQQKNVEQNLADFDF